MFLSLIATTKHQFTEMTLERKYLLLFCDLIVFIFTLDLILQLLALVEFVISMYLFINPGRPIIAMIETITDRICKIPLVIHNLIQMVLH